MKIVKIKAGLGNQMFQYAFARLLEEKYCQDVYLDFSYYDNERMRRYLVNGINLMRINCKVVDKKSLHKYFIVYNDYEPHKSVHRLVSGVQAVLNPFYYYERNRGYVDIDSIIWHSYFDGYWQSWRYLEPIRGILLDEFRPKNQLSGLTNTAINRYSQKESVFVGIRKGDYTASNKSTRHYGAPDTAYYKKAVSYILNRLRDPYFVIFSDDIEWIKSNFNFARFGISKTQIEYRDRKKIISDFEELFVMGSCKHAIISNSTFNFWGAWMIENPDKLVVAPKKWFKDEKPIDIIPPSWTQI